MKYFFSVLILCAAQLVLAQSSVRVFVGESDTGQALPFCNVSSKASSFGGITNYEGYIELDLKSDSETVVFSYLGYKPKSMEYGDLKKNPYVLMEKSPMILDECYVLAGQDFLYELVRKCRQSMKRKHSNSTSKVYYGIQTKSGNDPVELLECYYNAEIYGNKVEALEFKNGRVGLAPVEGNYFLSMNSSKALILMDIVNENSFFPSLPLQMSRTEARRKFNLRLLSVNDDVFLIEFTPIDTELRSCFSGQLWIEKETHNLLKIKCFVENASHHPFKPVYSEDSLHHVNFTIENQYQTGLSKDAPACFSFDYSFIYDSRRDSLETESRILSRHVESKGIMYFFDYNEPFLIPKFQYDQSFGDYRKMGIVPYNDAFWSAQNGVLLTSEQKESLGFFASKGQLVNYKNWNYGDSVLTTSIFGNSSPFFETYYCFWDREKRLVLRRDFNDYKAYAAKEINENFKSDLYHLEVQILLDVTRVADSLHTRSFTVFDSPNSFYHLPEDTCTRAFLNIYFDLCEIERMKMQKELDSRHYSLEQIDSVYSACMSDMETVSKAYFKEVALGKRIFALERWNTYVLERLGIDNIGMVEATDAAAEN